MHIRGTPAGSRQFHRLCQSQMAAAAGGSHANGMQMVAGTPGEGNRFHVRVVMALFHACAPALCWDEWMDGRLEGHRVEEET